MTTVVFATDLSDASGVAERLIGNLAWPAGTRIRLVTAVPWQPALASSPWSMVPPISVDTIEAEQEVQAQTGLAIVAARLAARGLDATWIVMRGPAADSVLDVATGEHADLIVVGSRGLGAVEGAVMGSVSSAIVDRAACPVLVARGDTIRRSLIADDRTPGAEVALDYVRERPYLVGGTTRLVTVERMGEAWAETFDMPIDAHSVQVLADNAQQLWREDAADLEQDAERLRTAGVDVESEVIEGSPGRTIVETAVAWQADLVVVGSRHRRGLTRLVLGSVGGYVMHHAHCSVLLVGSAGEDAHLPTVAATPPAEQDLVVPMP